MVRMTRWSALKSKPSGTGRSVMDTHDTIPEDVLRDETALERADRERAGLTEYVGSSTNPLTGRTIHTFARGTPKQGPTWGTQRNAGPPTRRGNRLLRQLGAMHDTAGGVTTADVHRRGPQPVDVDSLAMPEETYSYDNGFHYSGPNGAPSAAKTFIKRQASTVFSAHDAASRMKPAQGSNIAKQRQSLPNTENIIKASERALREREDAHRRKPLGLVPARDVAPSGSTTHAHERDRRRANAESTFTGVVRPTKLVRNRIESDAPGLEHVVRTGRRLGERPQEDVPQANVRPVVGTLPDYVHTRKRASFTDAAWEAITAAERLGAGVIPEDQPRATHAPLPGWRAADSAGPSVASRAVGDLQSGPDVRARQHFQAAGADHAAMSAPANTRFVDAPGLEQAELDQVLRLPDAGGHTRLHHAHARMAPRHISSNHEAWVPEPPASRVAGNGSARDAFLNVRHPRLTRDDPSALLDSLAAPAPPIGIASGSQHPASNAELRRTHAWVNGEGDGNQGFDGSRVVPHVHGALGWGMTAKSNSNGGFGPNPAAHATTGRTLRADVPLGTDAAAVRTGSLAQSGVADGTALSALGRADHAAIDEALALPPLPRVPTVASGGAVESSALVPAGTHARTQHPQAELELPNHPPPGAAGVRDAAMDAQTQRFRAELELPELPRPAVTGVLDAAGQPVPLGSMLPVLHSEQESHQALMRHNALDTTRGAPQGGLRSFSGSGPQRATDHSSTGAHMSGASTPAALTLPDIVSAPALVPGMMRTSIEPAAPARDESKLLLPEKPAVVAARAGPAVATNLRPEMFGDEGPARNRHDHNVIPKKRSDIRAGIAKATPRLVTEPLEADVISAQRRHTSQPVVPHDPSTIALKEPETPLDVRMERRVAEMLSKPA